MGSESTQTWHLSPQTWHLTPTYVVLRWDQAQTNVLRSDQALKKPPQIEQGMNMALAPKYFVFEHVKVR